MAAAVADYSWARPTPRALVDAGYMGVVRYLSREPGKNLSPGERDALFAAGLEVGLVWETTANRSLAGRQAGSDDAVEANRQADVLGWPPWTPLAYAVDINPSGHYEEIAVYFDGVVAASGRPVAVYGCYDIIEHLATHRPVACYWQCAAWSGKGAGSGGSVFVPDYGYGVRLSKRACLFQMYGSGRVAGTDHNQVMMPVDLLWHPNQEVDVTPDECRDVLHQVLDEPNGVFDRLENTKRAGLIIVHDVSPGRDPQWWLTDGIWKRRLTDAYAAALSQVFNVTNWFERAAPAGEIALLDLAEEIPPGVLAALLGRPSAVVDVGALAGIIIAALGSTLAIELAQELSDVIGVVVAEAVVADLDGSTIHITPAPT